MKIKRVCLLAMFLALAIVLNMVESLIPMFIPGVKLGLANCIVLIMLYELKWHEALLIMLLRILLVGLLRGNIGQINWLMSLSGGILSFLIMLLFSRLKFFTVIGTSVLGSIAHCFGQILIAMIVLQTKEFIYYLPIIAILSTLTGILTGLISKVIVQRKIIRIFLQESDGV